jgi:ABC-type ATPase involved in cell division
MVAAPDSENGVIQFENVGLRYGLGPEILRDLSFKITPHSFQFLSGPSGAGKTSLLRLLFASLTSVFASRALTSCTSNPFCSRISKIGIQ